MAGPACCLPQVQLTGFFVFLPLLSATLRAFVGRSFAKSVDEAKYAFFSDDLPQEDAVR